MRKGLLPFKVSAYPLIIAFGLLFPQKSFSQHLMFQTGSINWEAGFHIGPSFFLGDLGGKIGKGTTFIKDLNYEFTSLIKGVFITAYPSDVFGIRLAAQTGRLEGSDAIISTKGVDELWRKQRNLDFRTKISEAYIAAEVFPLMLLRSVNERQPRLRPYGMIGIGIFHFNPQGSLTDARGNKTWYYLHPLRTEGQGFKEYPDKKPYSLTQFNLPLGGGLKYYASNRFIVSMEVLHRKSFTDYIDDVSTTYIDPNLFTNYLSAQDAAIAKAISDKTVGIVTPGVTRYAPGVQRGSPKQNDSYFSILLKFGIQIGAQYGSRIERNAAHQSRCPVRF